MKFLAFLLLLPCCAPALADGALSARLEWVPCWFEPPFGQDVQCAHFYPSAPAAARQVRLPVVRIKTDQIARRDSPLLYLPAGPGSATGLDERGVALWASRLQRTRWPHDLVLFDVRGAGLAQPNLHCPEIVAADQAGLGEPLTAAEDLRRLQGAARACQARLHAAGVALADYSTARQVQDIGELLTLLGGRDWNLWGVSYGTRLAMHVARDYPQRVRSLVLDSAYPPEVNGLMAKPQQFAQLLERLAQQCAEDATCAAAHPQLARQLAELMRRLAARPVALTVEKWPAVWQRRLALNDYRLLWLLFVETYRPFHPPRYPHAIRAAIAGDFEPMLPLAEGFIDTLLDPDFSHGLYYATTCPEDLARVERAAYLAEVRRHPAVARHMEAEWDLHVCRDWDSGRLPARYHEPVRSDLPALFLSGADDPATPPRWARDAAAGFARACHHTFAGSSHAVTMENDCAMGVVWEFLADPRAAPHDPCRTRSAAIIGDQAATGLSLATRSGRNPQ